MTSLCPLIWAAKICCHVLWENKKKKPFSLIKIAQWFLVPTGYLHINEKNMARHISTQKMLQPWSHCSRSHGEPWGNSGWRQTGRLLPSSVTAATLQWCTLRRLRVGKNRILAPDSWGAYQRNDFSEPWLLYLPEHRKALNSLTRDIWFSLIKSNLMMFRLSGLCCKNSSISWLFPYLFWAVPQNWDAVSRA